MAQHDYVIANGTGAAVRSDLNNALLAIVSQNSGATEPTTMYAYQLWADTSTGLLKIRNSANNAWITLRELDGTLTIEDGTVSSPGLAFRDDLNTGIFRPGTDQFAISTNGVERVEWGASEVVFNDGGVNYDFRIEGDNNANLLFVDASADAVGIGTSSPQNQLHLVGSAATNYIRLDNSSGARTYIATEAAVSAIYAQNNAGGESPLQLITGSTPRIHIAAAGNVGIGTASPSTLLHIESTDPTFRFKRSDAAVNAYGEITSDTVGLVTIKCDPQNAGASSGLAVTVDNTERARIDTSGRLLVGTSSARANFDNSTNTAISQIETADSTARLSIIRNNGTPGLLLASSAGSTVGSNTIVTSGWTVGQLAFAGSDGSEFVNLATIDGAVDGTPGANDMPGRLVFSTTADGASSPTERMRISSAGGIFVNGATSPVAGNANDGIHVATIGTQLGNGALTLGDGVAAARWRIETGNSRLNFSQNNGSGTYNVRAYVNDSTGAYVQVSDQRAKKNIADSAYGIDDLKKLRAVSYLMGTQDEDTSRRNLGFIAQEVFEVIPEAVNKPEDEEQMYGLESIALIPVLVSSLQQAVAKIEQLEAKVAALESA